MNVRKRAKMNNMCAIWINKGGAKQKKTVLTSKKLRVLFRRELWMMKMIENDGLRLERVTVFIHTSCNSLKTQLFWKFYARLNLPLKVKRLFPLMRVLHVNVLLQTRNCFFSSTHHSQLTLWVCFHGKDRPHSSGLDMQQRKTVQMNNWRNYFIKHNEANVCVIDVHLTGQMMRYWKPPVRLDFPYKVHT